MIEGSTGVTYDVSSGARIDIDDGMTTINKVRGTSSPTTNTIGEDPANRQKNVWDFIDTFDSYKTSNLYEV